MLKEVTHELEWNVKGSDKWIGIKCWRKWHMNWNEMLNEVTHEMEWNVKECVTWNGRKCWKKVWNNQVKTNPPYTRGIDHCLVFLDKVIRLEKLLYLDTHKNTSGDTIGGIALSRYT